MHSRTWKLRALVLIARRPLLRTVKNSQHVDFVFHLVDSDKRQRCEDNLACARHSTGPPTVGEGSKRRNSVEDRSSSTPSGVRICVRQVVANALEIVGSVSRPPNAHQPG